MTDASVLVSSVGAIGLFAVATAMAVRHRKLPGADAFVFLLLALVSMTGFVVLGRTGVLSTELALGGLIICWMVASVIWAVFAFEYTGRGPTMTGRRVAGLLLLPAFVWVNAVIRRSLSGPFKSASFAFGSVVLLATISVGGFGVFLVLQSAISYDDLPSDRALVLTVFGASITLLALPASLETARFEVITDVVLLGAVAISATAVLVQRNYQLFESGPSTGHLARKTVLDQLSASVCVVGREGRLLDANREATRTFDIETTNAIGQSVDEVLGVALDVPTGEVISLETVDGRREFEVSRSSLTERHGTHIGHVYLFRDVTEQRTHEQRLEVLNRVLRHNLRNELDAVRAFAEALGDDGPMETPTVAARIRNVSQELVHLGTTVERAERLLAREALDREPVDVDALVQSVASDVARTYPDGELTISTPGDGIDARTDREILEATLAEVVDNALKHTGTADPSVTIFVRRADESVVVEVRDNGPAIPDHERAVLLDGEETPLQHGSGLGLWLVYWGVSRLGADISIGENDPSGSVVTIHIPT